MMCLSTDIDMLPLGPALLPSKPPDCNGAAGVALGPEARSWPRAGRRTDLILAFQCADCQDVASDLISERGIGDENCRGNMFHSAFILQVVRLQWCTWLAGPGACSLHFSYLHGGVCYAASAQTQGGGDSLSA